MSRNIYIARLIDRDNGVDKIIAVVERAELIAKIRNELSEEQGLEFETIASTWTSEFLKFQCLTCETCYLIVYKVKLVE